MESGGGTQLWCSNCDEIQECKVLWYDNDSKGNFVNNEYSDLHFRQRPRECNKCGHLFDTYEINSSVIDELIELRKLMCSIKLSINEQQKVPKGRNRRVRLPRGEKIRIIERVHDRWTELYDPRDDVEANDAYVKMYEEAMAEAEAKYVDRPANS